jgi:Arc/MetJ-type ribon-helix-helix transcriptional regulator
MMNIATRGQVMHLKYVSIRGVAMTATLKKAESTIRKSSKKGKTMPAVVSKKSKALRAGRERVLVEFPISLLERTDDAAAKLEKNRSELIRTAVEKLLEEMEKAKFEAELAAAYAANAQMNLELVEEFANVDREGF